MLDLSFLQTGRQTGEEEQPSLPVSPAMQQDVDPDDAYQRYLAEQCQITPGGLPMSRDDFERYSLGSDWLSGIRQVARKVVQTCRLMVGVHDYEYYLEHMRTRHPDATPLSRSDFYRYCLEARFPGNGNVNKCPC